VLRSGRHWRNYQPGHDGGGARADAEVLLNAAGRQLLADLCGVEDNVLARALPSWEQEDTKLPAEEDAVPAAAWRIGGAVAGPVAFGCRLCTARRTGTAVRMVRYAPLWSRVCVRHGRWLQDADADQPLATGCWSRTVCVHLGGRADPALQGALHAAPLCRRQ
jgi:hypothetical protein